MRASATIGVIILICALLGMGGIVTGVMLSSDFFRYHKTSTYDLKVVDNSGTDYDIDELDYCLKLAWEQDIQYRNKAFLGYTFQQYLDCLQSYTLVIEPTSFKINSLCPDGKCCCLIEANGCVEKGAKKIRFAGDVFNCSLFLHEVKHTLLMCTNQDSDILHKRKNVWGEIDDG